MSKKYSIIYADPPWSFNNKKTGGSMISGAEDKYPCMRIQDICKLPVGSICEDNCILFMWWVASMPKEALSVVDSWGFTIKTMTGFNWVKTTKNDKLHFGMGFYTRQGSENCLIAIKGKPQIKSKSVRAVQFAQNTKHSKKPSTIRDEIIRLCGNVSRIELFAREKTPGWDIWGNEIENDIKL